jgi:hypothetical protein
VVRAVLEVAVRRQELLVQPGDGRTFVVVAADVQDLHRQPLGVGLQPHPRDGGPLLHCFRNRPLEQVRRDSVRLPDHHGPRPLTLRPVEERVHPLGIPQPPRAARRVVAAELRLARELHRV